VQKVKLVTALPLLCVALGITVLSHMPAPPSPDMGFAFQDKVLHAFAYTVFGSTLGLAVRGWHPEYSRGRTMAIIVIGTALFGIYDEVHQYFVPFRESSVADWIADCVGAFLSLLFLPAMTKLAQSIRVYFLKSKQG
jgi:VanZ family protein